jgi:hypothetical protein
MTAITRNRCIEMEFGFFMTTFVLQIEYMYCW